MEWIQKGSKGDEVLTVQKSLKAKGFDPGPIDGIFGSKTEAAVRAFQEKNGLQVDGIVGPKTGGALGMLKDEGAEAAARVERMERGSGMKAKMETVTPEKATEAAKKQAATKASSGMEALKKAEASAAAKAKADADKATEAAEKVGGSLWSRITGRKR